MSACTDDCLLRAEIELLRAELHVVKDNLDLTRQYLRRVMQYCPNEGELSGSMVPLSLWSMCELAVGTKED